MTKLECNIAENGDVHPILDPVTAARLTGRSMYGKVPQVQEELEQAIALAWPCRLSDSEGCIAMHGEIHHKPGYVPPMPHVGRVRGGWGIYNHRGELVRVVDSKDLALAWTRLMPLGDEG